MQVPYEMVVGGTDQKCCQRGPQIVVGGFNNMEVPYEMVVGGPDQKRCQQGPQIVVGGLLQLYR